MPRIGTIIHRTVRAAAMLVLLAAAPAGCFTGVESTPKITGNDVRRQSLPGRNDVVSDTLSTRLTALRGEPLEHWHSGKTFIVTDPRMARRLQEVPTPPELHTGDTLIYRGMREVTDVIADTVTMLSFEVDGVPVEMRVDRSIAALVASGPFAIPMAVESFVIAKADSLLAPLKRDVSYVLTPNWLDAVTAQPCGGRRFVPVRFTGVRPGAGVYPLRLMLTEVLDDGSTGREICLLTDATSMADPSRPLSSLIAVRNPRLSYPRITDRHWQMIAKGEIEKGMTRDECRLALGAPAGITRESMSDRLVEVWSYDNGAYLIFADDLLERFRR